MQIISKNKKDNFQNAKTKKWIFPRGHLGTVLLDQFLSRAKRKNTPVGAPSSLNQVQEWVKFFLNGLVERLFNSVIYLFLFCLLYHILTKSCTGYYSLSTIIYDYCVEAEFVMEEFDKLSNKDVDLPMLDVY